MKRCQKCKGKGWVYRYTVVNPFGVCKVLDDDGKPVRSTCGSCYGQGVTTYTKSEEEK